MGEVLGAVFIAYALLQIPSGWVAYRLGTRRALPALAALWSACAAALALATGYAALYAGRLGSGAAQAGVFPCAVGSLARWYPPSRRAFVCGLLAASMSGGGAAATAVTGALVGSFSWRAIFFLFSLPGFVWALAFFWWFRDSPRDHAAVNAAEVRLLPAAEPAPAGAAPEPVPWRRILLHPVMLLLCAQQFFRGAGAAFYATWFPRFLKETRGVTTAESGVLSSLPILAIVAGSVAGGVLVDAIWRRTGSRRGVAVASLVASSGLIGLAYFATGTAWAMLLVTAGTFAAALAGPCAYAATMDTGGKHVSTVFGTMNMAGNIGAALCPLVVARFVVWSGRWNLVLALFAAIHLAGALAWAGIDPRRSIAPATAEAAARPAAPHEERDTR
jgi:MFS family permease